MRRPLAVAIVLQLAVIMPAIARSQDAPGTAGRPARATVDSVPKMRTPAPMRVTPSFGVHYGTPLRLSASAGLIADLDADGRDGLLVSVEGGQGGVEFSSGYIRSTGRFGTGVSLRAAMIRTFDHPWEATPKATYAGAELHAMVALGVGARVGIFRRAAGASGTNDSILSLRFSLGI